MAFAYDPTTVEAKWQKKWEEAKLHHIDLKKVKKPYYALAMFPYPSGDTLHVGHWYNFAPADSHARFRRMQGYDVFEPMGFDAFGLPAENYAIKTGVPPQESIPQNVATMMQQLKRIGCMYDWDRMVNTSQPEYYRWTQWLFIQMFMHGLAYKKDAKVNFCPSCQTVLANEQVWDGKCERCGTEVIQKPMEQWFWKTTQYAEKLLKNLDDLDWPEKTKTMQRNWIGRSEGAEITFEVAGTRRGVVGLKPQEGDTGTRGLKATVNQTDDSGGQREDQNVNRGVYPAASDVMSGLQPLRTIHLTIEPHNRQSVFSSTSVASAFLRVLDRVANRHSIVLHEACAMPDHVHLLISFDATRHLEKDVMVKLKGGTAHDFNQQCSRNGSLWGRGGHFEDVTSSESFSSMLRYIQENPTKAKISPEGRILSELPFVIPVFTTRPDTLFGVTYVVLAPEHPLVDRIVIKEEQKSVDAYREIVKKKTELQRTDLNKDKSGVPTGAYALHPVTRKRIPVWIADYALLTYGTGAVMAVPGHDERDFDFAKTYKLPIEEVVSGGESKEQAFTGEGVAINSEFLDGSKTPEAKKMMIAWLTKEGKGRGIINYRLRDWSIGRQRYWGAPIPIVYDPEGKPHPIPEEHLPWLLPTDVEFKPKGTAPLAQSKELLARTEKIFGKGWKPEVDTMDTFVCSSFYFLRYLQEDPKSEVRRPLSDLIDSSLEKKWLPVSMYIGGPEHACMHLIYARFVMMALKDFGFVSHEEPFKKLVHQGLITNKGAKMSKSKGNVVSPDSFIERHGSDVFRMYVMFMGPFTDGGDWSDTGIKGIDRFVQRVWKLLGEGKKSNKKIDQYSEIRSLMHLTTKRVTENIEKMHFNTAISALMECLNALEKAPEIPEEATRTFALLIAPLAPHLAEELWSALGGKGFVVEQAWPTYDAALTVSDRMTIAIQVNGKLRGTIEVASNTSKDEILLSAKTDPNVTKHLEGKTPKKEIYVPGKLVSFVI